MSQQIDFTHTIDAKLASNIGEESISSPVQAIAELVKNAYDADASQVWITFVGNQMYDKSASKKITKIIIRDDGVGMTLEDLQNKFFRIGTSNKLRNTISPEKGRRVVGEKGMGHVASKRLGNICKLISNPKQYSGRETSTSINSTITAIINWNDFEHGLNFSDIKSKGEIAPRQVNETNGIQIEISDLHRFNQTLKDSKTDSLILTAEDFDNMKRSLSMLLVPKHLRTNKDDEFSIRMKVPGMDDSMVELKTSSLDMALFRLTATTKFDKEQKTSTYSYFIDKRIPSKNSPQGFIWERVEFHNKRTNSDVLEGKAFGETKLVFYHFPQGGVKKFVEEQKKLLTRKEIQTFLKFNSGIKIFKDNVRIAPFGERGHQMYDWAEIDAKTLGKQMRGRIRQDTIAGYLTLSSGTWKCQDCKWEGNTIDERDSHQDSTKHRIIKVGTQGIQEISSRQGLFETDEFTNMKKFVNKMVEELSDYKKQFDKKESQPKVYHSEKALSDLQHAKKQLAEFIPDPIIRSQIEDHLKEVEHEIKEGAKERREFEEDIVSTQQMYNALSSLGISTLSMEHEQGNKFAYLKSHLDILLDENDLSDFVREEIEEMANLLSGINDWRQFIGLFSQTLGEFDDVQFKKNKIDLRKLIQTLFDKMPSESTEVITKNSKSVQIDSNVNVIGTNKTIYANRALLTSVISNLVLNSYKSLRFVQREKPKIKVTINYDLKKKELELLMDDNGNGINENNADNIWKPFWSSYPKHGKHEKFRGMGLGLTLTKNIIEDNFGGTIELVKTVYEKDIPGKGMTRFRITIPLSELKE